MKDNILNLKRFFEPVFGSFDDNRYDPAWNTDGICGR